MIYIRKNSDKTAVIDYSGTSRDLKLDILLSIKTMIDRKNIEENDLAVIILAIFKQLSDEAKIALTDLLVEEIKGGNLWQELEGLSKSEKK